MVQPANFRNKRWDDIKVSAAGPAMNLVQALVFALLTMTYVVLAIAENEEHGTAETDDPAHEHPGDQPDSHAAPQGTAA